MSRKLNRFFPEVRERAARSDGSISCYRLGGEDRKCALLTNEAAAAAGLTS